MTESGSAEVAAPQTHGVGLESLLSSTDLAVRQIVQTNVLECGPDTPLHAAAGLLRQRNCSSVLVVEDGHAVGIWTERDALSVDFTRPEVFQGPVREAMSQPVKAVPPDMSLQEVGERFGRDGVRHYLVAEEDGRRLGVISQTDVVFNQGLEHYLQLAGVESVVGAGSPVLDERASLGEAAERMRTGRSDAVVVEYADGGLGTLTERDLLRLIAEQVSETAVGPLASRPLVTVPSSYSLLQVRKVLQEHGFRHLGVVSEEDGELLGLIGLRDLLSGVELSYIQELREALHERDRALQDSRRHLDLAEKVIEHSMEGVMITDPQGFIQSVNPAFSQITGYEVEEVIGRRPSVLSSGLHGAELYRKMWASISQEGHWQGEIWNRRKDGEPYPQLLTITAIQNGRGEVTHYAGLFSDISELKENEERIKNLA